MSDYKVEQDRYLAVPLAECTSAHRRTTAGILPPFALPIVAASYILFGFGDNGWLALFVLGVFLFGCALLWRPGETPVLLFIFVFQWLQASVCVFYANWRGINVDSWFPFGSNPQLAIVLSLIGLVVLATGMRLGAGRMYLAETQIARLTVLDQPQSTYIFLYLVGLATATLAQALAAKLPGLSQPLLALANFKWATYFILTFATFIRSDSSRVLWLIIFLIELAMSFGGYFSNFKSVFEVTLIALIAAQVRMTMRGALASIIFGGALLIFALAWTAVKVEYRSFVSGGRASQAVVVNYDQSIKKLIELVSNLSAGKLVVASDVLIKRITYVEYFGVILEKVPRSIPHSDGALWLDAISRPFMPRLLFPQKEIIDDSVLTKKYTGLRLAGLREGTSVSIGYMGESYIDFGELGMMVPIFTLGLLLGGIYRWLMTRRNSRGIIGMGLSTAVLMTTVSYLENSTAKMFGALVVSVLVAWLLISYAVPILYSYKRK